MVKMICMSIGMYLFAVVGFHLFADKRYYS